MSQTMEQLSRLSPGEKRALLKEVVRRKNGGKGAAAPPASPKLSLASFAQQRLWFLDRFMDRSEFYNVSNAVRIKGPLDAIALERSLNEIVRRHEALRTSFAVMDRTPLQVIAPTLVINLPVVDLTGIFGRERQSVARRIALDHISRPFDLERIPLIRIVVLRTAVDEHIAVMTVHHIISDGWSMAVLIREIGALYESIKKNKPAPLPRLTAQYSDFAEWQRAHLAGALLKEQLHYWKEQLSGVARIELPTDRPRPAAMTFRGAARMLHLSEALSNSLAMASRRRGVTVFMTLLAGWFAVLSRYTGQYDIAVGSPIAGRSRPEFEDLIGLFLNMLVLRGNLSGSPSFLDLLDQVRETTLGAYQHQDVPFEQLVQELQPERDLSRQPLFQVSFSFENVPQEKLTLGGLNVEPISFDPGTTRFELELHAQESEGRVTFALLYNCDLFDDTTIERLLAHFQSLLREAVARPDKRLAHLELLSREERHQSLVEWNATGARYPAASLHELIEHQAAICPDAKAVTYEDRQISYRELNDQAARLAWRLRRMSAGPESVVGVYMHRSLDLVIALLGVLKAGAAYLPLDPDYPMERLKFLLADSDARAVVTQQSLLESLPPAAAEIMLVEPDGDAPAVREGLAGRLNADHLAYVIYTSGSTGAPKAAMTTHRAIVNRLAWMQSEYRLTGNDCVLQKTPFSFDVSVWELFWPLLNGASLVLAAPGGHRDRDYLFDLIEREQISTLHFVPSMLSAMLGGDAFLRCHALTRVFSSGEELSSDIEARFRSSARVALHNLYGPTEAAVDVTFSQCRPTEKRWRVPIGRPVANTQVYVLDHAFNPVVTSATGEAYIGGIQVGRGYRGRSDLTAGRFIPDLFSPEPGARLYKTGDLARFLSDGQVEFLGRVDHQLKIRGHRIEPSEIEAVLKQHPSVREAAVLVSQDSGGHKRLLAYLVAGAQPDRAELRNFASERLPDYMIPSSFLFVDALPLTASGKLDRRALLKSGRSEMRVEGDYTAPSTPQEKTLCDIWADVLRLKRVGVQDNFFALGGDSIISIQIIDRANREGLRLTARQLFQHQTVSELAAVAGIARSVEAEQGPVFGDVPLTPIQKRFFEKHPVNPHHYNQALLLELKQSLNPRYLSQAILFLVQHHDALRMKFWIQGGEWKQFNSKVADDCPDRVFRAVDLSKLSEEDGRAALGHCADAMQRSFDLSTGPLFRAALFTFEGRRRDRLLLIIHHLAVDGVSWRILLEDLPAAYDQLSRNRSITPGAKTTSYKRWAEELVRIADSDHLRGEIDYWAAHSRTEIARLPVDGPGGDNSTASARAVRFWLNEQDTQSLLTSLPEKYRAQINDALVMALAESIRSWTGSARALVDLEGHGREEIIGSVDLSRTVGWFTSVFPVLLDLPAAGDAVESLKAIKEQLRAVPNRGAGYGILRYLGKQRSASPLLPESDEAGVILNYLGQFDGALAGSAFFDWAPESAGATQDSNSAREYLVEVTGLVSNKQLNVSITYSSNLHRPETIESLKDAMRAALVRLAERCRTSAPSFTPSDFPLARIDQQTLDAMVSGLSPVEDIYPASPLQQGLLFHSLYSTAPGLYLNQLSYRIEGVLDLGAFKQAWTRIVARHAIWRTAFMWEELEEPVQVVLRTVHLDFDELDWRHLTDEQQATELDSLIVRDRRRPFVLSGPPLARFTLIRLAGEVFQLLWSHHHLISDGWSAAIVLKEVRTCYEALRLGKEPMLQRPRPYRDYIAWLKHGNLSEAEAFWSKSLKGFDSPTPVPGARSGSGGPNPAQIVNDTISLSKLSAADLRSFAGRHRLTINTLVQGAWAMLLGRYSGEQDVVFGATTAGRPAELSGVESMVGVFINTSPVRTKLPAETSVIDWLSDLQNQQVEQRQYEYSPLVKVQKWSGLPPGQHLFDTLLVFENYPIESSLGQGSFRVTSIRVIENPHYPLTLMASLDRALVLQLSFDRNRIEPDAAAQLLDHLNVLLENLIANPSSHLDQIEMLGEEERLQVVYRWNQTRASYPVGDRIYSLFEAQVRRAPDATALVFDGHMISYGALNARSDDIAFRLHSLGVAPGDCVAVQLGRSPEMISSLLAILNLSAAYVPLDPSYPAERRRFILKDARVRVNLIDPRLQDGLEDLEATLLSPDDCAHEQCGHQIGSRAFGNNSESEAGYLFSVIYTSGSTGIPKGVLQPYSSFINRFNWMWSRFPFDSTDVCCQKTSIGFVDSIWETLGPLLSGVTTVIIPEATVKDPASLIAALGREHVTRIVLVPSLLRAILELDPQPAGELRSLRYCFSSGEELPPALAHQFSALLPHCALINLYGSAEVAADITLWDAGKGRDAASVPIGQPAENVTVYVLDRLLRPMPIGVPGRICCGGAQLAYGYLNQPDLTASRFLPHPFADLPGERIYDLGDVGRFAPDGRIEYIGRADHQVKIRGFRIEMGEIEAALSGHPQVRAAVVTSTGSRLIAYLIAQDEQRPSLSDLRAFLSTRLPDYMLPAAFLFLDAFPLTSSGKLNRSALPEPSQTGPADAAPRLDAPIREIIAGIWAQLLNVAQVRPDDNFFEVGGHSLLATQLHSRLKRLLNVDLPLSAIFEAPALSALTAVVESAARDCRGFEYAPIEHADRLQELPLSFSQERLWFLNQLDPDSFSQNLPVSIRLAGRLDIAAIESSLREVARRHETLRTSFAIVEDRPVQKISPAVALNSVSVDLAGLVQEAREAEAGRLLTEFRRKVFDLSQPPLWRVLLLRLEELEHLASLTMHHIISDQWSLGVLVDELMRSYAAVRMEPSSLLAPLPLQYADFAVWQRNWLEGEVLQKQLAYWTRQLAGAPPLLELPTDRLRPPVQSDRGAAEGMVLDASIAEPLRMLSRTEGATLFMTFLAAFQVLMGQRSGQNDVVVGCPVSGRTRNEIEGLIGCFINAVPVRTDLSGNPTFKELLGQVRHTALAAYGHQDLPFEALVDGLHSERRRDYQPVFQVVLNFQNAPAPDLVLPGLTVSMVPVDTGTANYDMTLYLKEHGDSIAASMVYNRDLFDRATIQRLLTRYRALLSAVAADSSVTLAALNAVEKGDMGQTRMIDNERKKANLDRLKQSRRKAVNVSAGALVKTGFLQDGQTLPLTIAPAASGVDLAGWAGSNLDFIEAQLLRYGAILFRGFDVDSPEAFDRFARSVTPELVNYVEGSSPRNRISDKVYSSTEYPPEFFISLHNELSYAHKWPGRLLFYCAIAPLQGGETAIADCREVLRMLDPKIVTKFERLGVKYVRRLHAGGGVGLSWQSVFETPDRQAVEAYCREGSIDFEWEQDGSLRTSQVRPGLSTHPRTGARVWFNQADQWHPSNLGGDLSMALRSLSTEDSLPINAYYGDGSPLEPEVLDEVRSVFRRLTVAFPWQAGDVLQIDNMLVAHGRNPYSGPRKVLVAMGSPITAGASPRHEQ
ncbi:MAG TPA: amino acid adenylation domain-containing protein [Blastocatellia bacterium]|nr:amino acid adenylation domain-containing protein [Blastocatellia bacterium]